MQKQCEESEQHGSALFREQHFAQLSRKLQFLLLSS